MFNYNLQFPDLTGIAVLALDCETHDVSLKTLGPGYTRGDSTVLGISLAWQRPRPSPIFGLKNTVDTCYLPIAHATGNLDKAAVIEYLKSILSNPEQTVVGANISYDLGHLATLGIFPKRRKADVQIIEALLDENKKSYSLASIAEERLDEAKLSLELAEAVVAQTGCKPSEIFTNLWRCPSQVVEPYARRDAELTLRIFMQQQPEIADKDLTRVYELESRLTDALMEMQRLGISFDISGAEKLKAEFQLEFDGLMAEMLALTGREELKIWSQEQVAEAAHGLSLTGLLDGNKESFSAPWMVKQSHRFFQLLLKLRQLNKAGSAFIDSFLTHQHRERLYCSYHQTRSDRGGTVSGRLSCVRPNLQQLPKRNTELAPKIRYLFFPERDKQFAAFDMSQVELRLILHYASSLGFSGAKDALDQYLANPDADYYQGLANDIGIERFAAKQLWLSHAYGAGQAKIADLLGLPLQEARKIFERFHKSAPYIRLLAREAARVADSKGYVKTLLGRRRNFNLFGPPQYGTGMLPLPYEAAVKQWPGVAVRRWFTHKALNATVQGSAADLMKLAIVQTLQAGYVPHATVHDELIFSVPYGEGAAKAIAEIKNIMENPQGVQLTVPLLVNVETGYSLGRMKPYEHK